MVDATPFLGDAHPDPSTCGRVCRLTFDEVISAESRTIEERKAGRVGVSDASGGVEFSLAFGGGGVRAAAFEAGVLWRLAESGCLQSVKYLSANSGGSYIATAFASHLCEAQRPSSLAATNAFYLRAVGTMVERMLRNVPYVARSPTKHSLSMPTDGSSCLPRIFDVPIFFAVFTLAFICRPLMIATIVVCPLLEAFEWLFGAAMRLALCAPQHGGVLYTFLVLARFTLYLKLMLLLLAITFVAWVAGKCGARSKKRLGIQCWLWVRSSVAALNRLTAFLFSLLVLATTVVVVQDLLYSNVEELAVQRSSLCARYYRKVATQWKLNKVATEGFCFDEALLTYTRESTMRGTLANVTAPELASDSQLAAYPGFYTDRPVGDWSVLRFLELRAIVLALMLLLALALVLVPLLPRLFLAVLRVFGPAVALGVVGVLVQWRIFSPILGEPVSAYMHQLMLLAIVVLPFYSWLASAFHLFYRRCLQKAFSASGEDITWGQIRANPYCPYLLFNGTITDYMRPGDISPVSEMFFSMLHIGGDRTQYLKMRPTESVAKFMAISAAATDALILGMHDLQSNRFWLSILGFSLGRDLLLDLDHERSRTGRKLVRLLSGRHEWLLRKLLRAHRRLPALILSELIFVCLLTAHHLSSDGAGTRCQEVGNLYLCAGLVSVSMFVLSFFGFVRGLEFLVEWPVLQQLHQMTRFYHCAERPPKMLYVSDGGAVDSSGVLQLLRRRCERILFVLNEDDPADRLPGLRKMLVTAIDEKLAAFYDPADPRCDWKEVLQAFAADVDATYLQLGIHYGWQGEPRSRGHLVVIKNRVPSKLQHSRARPLLTEAEIVEGKPQNDSNWLNMGQTHLGGCACCCDCCHLCCFNSCGRKFPNAPIVNQLLTPQYLSELCRLGHDVSAEAVELITQRNGFEYSWERHVVPMQRQPSFGSFQSFSTPDSADF